MYASQKKFPIYTQVSDRPHTICEAIDPKVFDYPFFNEGIIELKNLQYSSKSYILEDIKKCKEEDLLELKGFIFHTSHCGSTLLSRMLCKSSEIRIVSETEAINGLLLSYLFYELEKKEVLEQLKSIIDAYRQPLQKEQYVIFKLASWNIFMTDLFQELYPSTKSFYIDRNTEEVVASLQKSNGGMQDWFYHPVDCLRKHFVGNDRLFNSKEKFLTCLIENHRKQYLKFKNENLCLITYPDFLEQFDTTILNHLDLNYSAQEINKMKSEMNYYSKSHEKKRFITA
ncbi:hypothetical protein LX97_00751 [Nonlabens dokdonensis]|uniref:Aspartyl/Asparaginyl beta-hydroxylase n=2 Tax=Nonlabens dokdonensis TaxID=328515 RepID=L7W8E4_NONDD|nr:hypothetical protein [Nonlabens dokdonensis]AGC76076.1 aspartyl/Asparaginyl beta-hydroxylase [Nonlabens dokdonensis DSW-6]PZX43748.1 hypothetical protein LX97_00751 [Nonlabens dokdonensis]